jgi:hypothetical protein
MRVSRRRFLGSTLGAGAAALAPARRAFGQQRIPDPYGRPIPWREIHGDSSVMAAARNGDLRPFITVARPQAPPVDLAAIGSRLRARFKDLRRHFIFEYYAWYRSDPWSHWNESGHQPPVDLATNYYPALGPYSSADRTALERHARWIAESGAGAVNVSWWGPDSYSNGNVDTVMDVMRDHDIHVTFHLEPYTNDHAALYADDVMYLISRYGDRRGWDCFLLLEDAQGRSGPVFKTFRTLLPQASTDCHGVTSRVPDYAPDSVWHAQTARVRHDLRQDFDRVLLLGDSFDVGRTRAAGLDGFAIYDNFVEPTAWAGIADTCRNTSVLFSFNTNPGYDAVVRLGEPAGSCYRPSPFIPGKGDFDWASPRDRRTARMLSGARVHESFATTLSLQTDETLSDWQQGFFLVYLTSFNEWFEGHAFEPMRDWADLTADERTREYHNAVQGDYRLTALTDLLKTVLEEPASAEAEARSA